VLNAARAVIDRNRHRTPKHLFSDRGDGNRIVIHEAVDDHAEAAFVVDSIRQMLDAGAARGGESKKKKWKVNEKTDNRWR